MDGFEQAIAYLPSSWQTKLRQLPANIREDVHEIRLRTGAPLILSTSVENWFIHQNGQPTVLPSDQMLTCSPSQLESIFLHMCNYSIHSHQQEILQGYVSTECGMRVGIAGNAVTERGEVVSIRNITSLCMRVNRPHIGCADPLLNHITENGRLCSTLICGEPSSGKTSLLRDLASRLSEGIEGKRYRVSVVDERGELSFGHRLANCDVLLHFPKAIGVLQGVRCLAPDVVMFDELGSMDEAQAVIAGLNAGAVSISTAHGSSVKEILRRPPIFFALRQGGFDKIVFLCGKQSPGEISISYDRGELGLENIWDFSDYNHRHRDWNCSCTAVSTADGNFAML